MTQTIASLLSDDNLDEAVALAIANVKAKATSAQARMELGQLLAIAGDLARAETHAKMAQTQAPELMNLIATFRANLRGLEAREAWWNDGAAPDIPQGPSDCDKDAVQINIALREADGDAASAAAATLEEKRGPISGRWNGTAFDDLRDLDDRLPHAIEAVTSGGNYLWIDLAKVKQITCAAPATPFDLLCRQARVTLHDGASGEMFLPAVYAGSATAAERLGRVTEFDELPGGLMAARGQRSFIAGDEVVGFLDLEELDLDG